MAEQGPSRNDIQLIFKKLRSVPCNKVCFDCNAKNPTWASVTYGVFICIDCSAVHRGLGVHVTFVRSINLDTNWTWLQLRQMQFGGNANAKSFFRQHNCITSDAQQKYNSRAAQLYKEKLRQIALHGNPKGVAAKAEVQLTHLLSLHIDSSHEEGTVEGKKDVDFFTEMSNKDDGDFHQFDNSFDSQTPSQTNGSSPATDTGDNKIPDSGRLTETSGSKEGPNVDCNILTSSNSQEGAAEPRKSVIGSRKAPAKRTTLGAKKGGLGAQKVKANFAEIEREACLADERKEREEATSESKEEDTEKQIASVRLAYQDLSIKQKQEEEKLKLIDPQKAQQVERLGMGFGTRGGISHSALSDMKTIEQEKPAGDRASSSRSSILQRDSDGFFDEFQFSSSGLSMYKSSPGEGLSFESMLLDSSTRFPPKSWETEQPRSTTSPRSEERPKPQREIASGNEAQKKFGSAKAISSDQYFRDSSETNWERQSNLSRFEGSSSISSAEYFGESRNVVGSGGFSSQFPSPPDLEDVKESVRQGVTKVAGKLSSLANGVMSSIQDRYGY